MSERITDWDVVQAMHLYGGSFAKALAVAMDKADLDNQRKIKEAFSELWGEYLQMAQMRKDRAKTFEG